MKLPLNLWALLCAIFLFSCGTGPEKQARELIERSIEAHGGADAWEKVNKLGFRKKTRLIREDGTVEAELDERMEFRFKPYLEGKITWERDSIKHVSTWDGAQMSYFMGENEVKNAGFLAAKRKEFDSGLYEATLPWRLLDEETVASYEGLKTLENGRLVASVLVENGPEGASRSFYFDPKSAVMVGSEIRKKDERSLVYNLGYIEVEGLMLPGQVESWRVDENGEKLFLSAEYLYFAL